MESPDPKFHACIDVPNAGVLLALPALLATGLLRHAEQYFDPLNGFYGLYTIFILLAFMLLSRIKTIEGLRYCPPGEWGKLLGIDRIPEVKTLRQKIRHLAQQGKSKEWSAQLCKDWMNNNPEEAMTLYVDGHVRVYHGSQANLPKHYVSRQKLCLHATCDYWVNAMNGSPFFVVSKDIDSGLINALENDIIPRLEKEVPGQPTKARLKRNPLLHRFILVFDREGYSPELMLKMKKKRIACVTYRKRVKDEWDKNEFKNRKVTLVSGEVVEMDLAERGSLLGGKVWVREIRRLMENGHQTAIVSTAFTGDMEVQAMGMFARWSQENFFKYMRQHYNLDRLIEYSVEELPDNTKVVNPKHRRLESTIKSKVSTLNRKLARFASITIEGEIEGEKIKRYQAQKAALQEEINLAQEEIEQLKVERKNTSKHVAVSELPEEQRLQRLSTESKDFLDTLKMIAYRAETAMVNQVREVLKREDDARSFIRSLYQTEGDIIPDEAHGVLKIRLHHLTTKSADEVLKRLCTVLNETETVYPGTKLKLVYEMVS
jgi:hypothetical protein